VRRSLGAQAQLAALPDVSHRVKPIDLLVAAVAEHHGSAVLHYDADYELLAERTDLALDSVWAAERAASASPQRALPGVVESRSIQLRSDKEDAVNDRVSRLPYDRGRHLDVPLGVMLSNVGEHIADD
jgi:hypothetical protein